MEVRRATNNTPAVGLVLCLLVLFLRTDIEVNASDVNMDAFSSTEISWDGSSTSADSTCKDDHDDCPGWADLGECAENPNYMLQFCRKSCFVCFEEDTEDEALGVKQRIEGNLARRTAEIVLKMQKYFREEVVRKREFDLVRKDCKNRHELCAFWVAVGECEVNPDYMTLQCALACRTCHLIDINNRCPLDSIGPDAVGPGDLNRLFEKISNKTEGSDYAHLNPVIFSRPSHPTDGDSQNDDHSYDLGPWIVAFDNFLTHEECDRMIELGHKEGYERSTDVGARKFDGSYGGVESNSRTSENAWCQNECYDDPVAQRVIGKITNLTGFPETNSEHLQLLKYEVGQLYGPHHDFIPHHIDRRCGPRVLTLFLYLNDVEQGGGTRFTRMGITVTPKKGRALLWPSVLNEDPNAVDRRTGHEALKVEAGIKYGANAWLHLRDFKNPNKAGCV